MASGLLAAHPVAPHSTDKPWGGRSEFSHHACLLWFLVLDATWCPKVASVTEEAPRSGSPKDEAPLDGKWKSQSQPPATDLRPALH